MIRLLVACLLSVVLCAPWASARVEAPVSATAEILNRVIEGGIKFEREPIESVVDMIERTLGVAIVKDEQVQGRVTVNFANDVTLDALLDAVTWAIGATYRVDDDGTIRLVPGGKERLKPADEALRDEIRNRVIKGGMSFEDTPIHAAIAMLGAEAGVTIIMTSSLTSAVRGNVTGDMDGNPTVGELLDTILPPLGGRYYVTVRGVIHVMTLEQFELIQASWRDEAESRDADSDDGLHE